MANLTITERETAGVVVLDLTGDLIFGDACGILRKKHATLSTGAR